MKGILYISILLMLAAGCSRHIDSPDLSQKLPNRPPVPVNLKAIHFPEGLTLSWQAADTSVIRFFRIFNSDSINGSYVIWDSTVGATFSKPLLGLVAERNYFFRVASVTTSGLEGNLSSAISVAFGPLSIIINNDDKYTRTRDVTITFTAPASTNLAQLSENSDFADARWETIAPTLGKTLSSGDGVKRLFARFQFNDGSESGGLIGDSIILDTRAEIDTAYFRADAPVLRAADIVTFFLDCGEADGEATVSFSTITGLKLYDDGTNGDLISADGIYTRRFIIPVNMVVADGIVTGQFIDVAGNAAEDRIYPSVLNVVKSPDAVNLVAASQSSSSIRLSWSQSISDEFAAYYLYRDNVNAISENSTLVTAITSRGTLSFTDNNLGAGTKYFYRIYVHDNNGFSTASNIDSVTTAVNVPPSPVRLAARAELMTSILTWTTNTDDDFSSYQIYRGTQAGVSETTGKLLSIINDRATATFTDTRPDTLTYYYKIYVFDQQGMSSGSNEVSIP